jgi:hypothetical protein
MLRTLLIMILVSSHGTMGMAAPHHDGADHVHVGQHSHDAEPQAGHDDHHGVADVASDEATADADDDAIGGTDDAAKDAGSNAAHAHASADQVPSAFAIPERLPGSSQLATLLVTRLVSTGQSPLLEPPSA